MASVRDPKVWHEVVGQPFTVCLPQRCYSCRQPVDGQWAVNARTVGGDPEYAPLYHIGCINEAPVPTKVKAPEFTLLGAARDWDFTGWLTAVTQLQGYGRKIETEGTFDADSILPENIRREFFRTNILSAIVELTEMLDEAPWKPWAKDGAGWNEIEIAQEAVDALHFIGNALRLGAPDVGGFQLAEMYRDKTMKNAARWRDGYRGRADKCPSCKRDKSELPSDHTTFTGTDDSYISCNYAGR